MFLPFLPFVLSWGHSIIFSMLRKCEILSILFFIEHKTIIVLRQIRHVHPHFFFDWAFLVFLLLPLLWFLFDVRIFLLFFIYARSFIHNSLILIWIDDFLTLWLLFQNVLWELLCFSHLVLLCFFLFYQMKATFFWGFFPAIIGVIITKNGLFRLSRYFKGPHWRLFAIFFLKIMSVLYLLPIIHQNYIFMGILLSFI